MSSREWHLRVQDILNAIASIQRLTAEMTFDEFSADEAIVKAVLYNFTVIGEASASISINIQSRYPGIPWRLMSDMRNVIAHEYFQVDLSLTWNTIQNNLPPLATQLQNLPKQEK
ncbi:MAG: DUF86 domain-containing protein [Leptolyngbyaceae cyanobacterium SL_5_14]|nr:DUF86 domain-containing protein [Leptolyngbyaceae cyanobacterium SL_5_14]